MSASTPSSDLALILSQYRVMTYHNLETGKDEGIVFVKKDEDASTGELIRWTGQSEADPNNNLPVTTTSTASSSTSTKPIVTSPSSRSSGLKCAGTSPSTSQKSYKKPNEERSDQIPPVVVNCQLGGEKSSGLNLGRNKLKLIKKSSSNKSDDSNRAKCKGIPSPSSNSTSSEEPQSSSKSMEVAIKTTIDHHITTPRLLPKAYVILTFPLLIVW